MLSDTTNAKYEIWKCDDPRLPVSENIKRTPPESAFLDSMVDPGQMMPIGMAHFRDDNWDLIFGRKRLLAIRKLMEDGRLHGEIKVLIFENVEPQDIPALSMIENKQRSDNPLSEYMAIRAMLLQGFDYKAIAKAVGISVSSVKAADHKFATVPQWALEYSLNGMIAQGTAIEIGKCSTPKQSELLKQFADQGGKLTIEDVKQARRFIQNTATAQIMANNMSTQPRSFYSREELLPVMEFLNDGKIEDAKDMLDTLLKQVE